MELADVALLTSDQGRALLDRLTAEIPRYSPDLALRVTDGLRRRGVDPKLTAAALTQVRLRGQARAKFGEFAERMLFTDQGLQQSTRLTVAALHARRHLAAGARRVADLTGGIGGDALAMAALGLRVDVYENDPVTAAVAAANLAAFPEARVILGDSLAADLTAADTLWADPSRRTAKGRRIFDPDAYRPSLARLMDLARHQPLGVKAGPGIPHSAVPPDAEAQWVSEGGDVVEATLWFGALRSPGAPARTALVLRNGRAHVLTPDAAPRLPAGPLAAYIYEPDGAVIRASLIEQAAAPLAEPRLTHPRIAYVTSDTKLVDSPFLTGHEVLDAFPFSLKRLRSYVRANGIGQLTVKKRGTAVEPAELRKRLHLQGERSAVVILTRLGAEQSVLVVSPLQTP